MQKETSRFRICLVKQPEDGWMDWATIQSLNTREFFQEAIEHAETLEKLAH
jgi:hypothetical protein